MQVFLIIFLYNMNFKVVKINFFYKLESGGLRLEDAQRAQFKNSLAIDRSSNPIVCLLSKPGLMLQQLTTKEPDDSMIEVAIASVEAVFDWEEFLRTYHKEQEEE